MTPKFYLFFIILTLNSIFVVCGSSKCAQIYLGLMFSETFKENYKGEPGSFNTLVNFQLACGRKVQNFRKIMLTFNFATNRIYTCLSMNVQPCGTYLTDEPVGQLNTTKNYSIRQQFETQVNDDSDCMQDSLVIFITDIKCEYFAKYPDMEEVFGQKKFDETRKFLLDKKLQTLLVWVQSPKNPKNPQNPCPWMKNLQFLYAMEYFETRIIQYTELYSDKTNLCLTEMGQLTAAYNQKNLKDSVTIGLSIACGVVFLLIILFVAFWTRQIHRRWRESKIEAFAHEHSRNARYLLFGKFQDEWEVTAKELKVDQGKVLGKGAFGTVYKGHLKKIRNNELIEMDVAVKFPNDFASEVVRVEMLQEIKFMKELGNHENLLVMVGYVKSIENPVICTVFCSNGNLLSALKRHPLHFMSFEKCEDVEICLLLRDLLRLSIEVCNGLVYLTSLKYIHRDIAARNILLTENCTAKLSDFGLCRQLEDGQDFIVDKEGKFPVKHMPFEALKRGQFSEKSDMWSFGVLTVEMFSGGQKSPFHDIPIEEFLSHLENNGLPNFSSETPKHIVQVINEKCFKKEPKERGTFVEIKEELIQFYYVVKTVVK